MRIHPVRADIFNLQPNGIARVALLGLGDKDLIPLWFGETDLVTPEFIREAAKRALNEGVPSSRIGAIFFARAGDG